MKKKTIEKVDISSFICWIIKFFPNTSKDFQSKKCPFLRYFYSLLYLFTSSTNKTLDLVLSCRFGCLPIGYLSAYIYICVFFMQITQPNYSN